MTDLGELSLWLALLMSVWGLGLATAGGALRRADFSASGVRGLHAAAGFAALAALALGWALVSADFSLRYVATFTSFGLPAAFRVSALWAGRAGSLVLWAVALAAAASVATAGIRARDRALEPRLASLLGAALAVSLAAAAISVEPFARLSSVPGDGRGLDPELQNVASLLDMPCFIIGAACATIWLARALALATLARDRADPFVTGTRWSLAAFCALTGSCVARLWWVYAERGTPPSLAAFASLPRGTFFALVLALAMGAAAVVGGARRRRGGYVTAFGALLVVTGFAAAGHSREYLVTVRDGESVAATDAWGVAWSFTSQGASRIERPGYFLTALALMPRRAGVRQPFIVGERREYYDAGDRQTFAPYTRAAVRSSPAEDVRVAVPEFGNGAAAVRIAFHPLVSCVWIGALLAVGGVVLACWPRADRAPVTIA